MPLHITYLKLGIKIALHPGVRFIRIEHAFDICSLIESADQWPRALRTMVLQLHNGTERPDIHALEQLKAVCRARRVILQTSLARNEFDDDDDRY